MFTGRTHPRAAGDKCHTSTYGPTMVYFPQKSTTTPKTPATTAGRVSQSQKKKKQRKKGGGQVGLTKMGRGDLLYQHVDLVYMGQVSCCPGPHGGREGQKGSCAQVMDVWANRSLLVGPRALGDWLGRLQERTWEQLKAARSSAGMGCRCCPRGC